MNFNNTNVKLTKISLFEENTCDEFYQGFGMRKEFSSQIPALI